ncbi:carotenoid 9,10(9',10')-cleavage dioxygenase 1-like isoform X3 [Oryza glaberrima]|uniref:carotenoid 9,10(9',10')-cleavage dioxygenase 1-like isoform X3 n=1 Tax=Oryza glaberrima TaxID=4538 RepID=UPI00224C43EF|nr:carotenoid 9,10(9',10')-cleavage dioxygenase 1-like isoform X3 [Oryza glaberrima]
MATIASMHMYGFSLQPRLCSTRGRPAKITRTKPLATHDSSAHIPPRFKELQQVLKTKLREASAAGSSASKKLLDAFVDSIFTFSHQSLRPTESNFAPVEEIGQITNILRIEGAIPEDFPEGVYIRNGPNPLFGALHTVNSIFGQTEDIWVEGEGMLHALYFNKKGEDNTWSISYNNRYVQSDTFRIEKDRQKPCFLSSAKGDPIAIFAASILNKQRFGKASRNYSNTNVFQHAGRVFSAAENDNPHEIDLENLGTICSWDVGGDWNMPFTAHPKVAPGSGDLVIHGFSFVKPFLTVGVISEDGKKLKHKVDLKQERCAFSHEIGITERYNIIMDMPLTMNLSRILQGAPFLDYEAESYARIGVMPRYGDADSVIWFDVEPFCTIHLVNCFEEHNEVVMRGFRVPGSILMGPTVLEHSVDEEPANQGLNEEYFSRLYEWRLNMKSMSVIEKYLTGAGIDMEFPVINDKYVGLNHKYAYAQVVDSQGSLAGGCGIVRPKFGGFAKLYLEDKIKPCQDLINVEYHHLGRNKFCSGATFVPKVNGANEDDGWIISFVHDEEINNSQAHIIDAQRFENGPVAKIILKHRVPYGFHGAFISRSTYKKR